MKRRRLRVMPGIAPGRDIRTSHLRSCTNARGVPLRAYFYELVQPCDTNSGAPNTEFAATMMQMLAVDSIKDWLTKIVPDPETCRKAANALALDHPHLKGENLARQAVA